MLAKMLMRVPTMMRDAPLCASSQALSRCAGVMPLFIVTISCAGKRSENRSSSCGVRLISGTMMSTWAFSSASNTRATARKYTSVLPLPVLPKSKAGLFASFSEKKASIADFCSALSATKSGAFVSAGTASFNFPLRLMRLAICAASNSRSCGGSAASATSPSERW